MFNDVGFSFYQLCGSHMSTSGGEKKHEIFLWGREKPLTVEGVQCSLKVKNQKKWGIHLVMAVKEKQAVCYFTVLCTVHSSFLPF